MEERASAVLLSDCPEIMKELIQNLLALQTLELSAEPLALQDEEKMSGLRSKLPKPILDHFDRLIARGKKGVAMVRGTSCGECHLQIPTGTLHALPHHNDIHICDNCGRYLCLPEAAVEVEKEMAPPPAPAKPARRKRAPKAAAAAPAVAA